MKIDDAKRQEGQLRFLSAKHFVLLIRTSFASFKVARITFGGDGSIYVQFPYSKHKEGTVAELNIPATQTGPTEYPIGEIGLRVPTDVKFSHHASGIAQFSKSGFPHRLPRRQSFPLSSTIGHLFDFNVYWLSGFQELTRPRSRAVYIGFDFPERHPGSVLITAQWRRKRDIMANIHPPGGLTGPATSAISRRTGQKSSVYFLGPPATGPLQDHVILLSGGEQRIAKGMDEPGMIFFGGLDPHEVVDGDAPAPNTGALMFVYPALGGRSPNESNAGSTVVEPNNPAA